MLIQIKTFNGVAINDGTNYSSALINPRAAPDISATFIENALADSVFSGHWTTGVDSIPITLKVNGSNLSAITSQLKEALKPGTRGDLVVTFTDEARDYLKDCVVQSLTPVENYPRNFILILQSGETTWESVDEVTDTWEVTANGDTKEITVGGYSETCLSVEMTPTELPVAGWAFQRLYELPNVKTYALGLRPWCITLDTATLITAGKMQSDCDDIRIVINGVMAKRWIADPNDAATKIWINLDMAAGHQMTLLSAVASSGAMAALEFSYTANNINAINSMPVKGIVKHGNEWFEYTGKVINKKKNCVLTGVTRAAYGTSMQAHSVNDTFVWIQNVIHVMYGNSAATDPSTEDTAYDFDKPIFDLEQSSNAQWVYTDVTGFYDAAHPTRPGSWSYSITKYGTESEVYLVTGDAESGDPAMGMHIKTYLKNNIPYGDSATITWMLSGGVGITTISSTGRKYRSAANWLGVNGAKLERSPNKITWTMLWSELTPTAAASWESWTRASTAMGTVMTNIRFSFIGNLPALRDLENFFEVLTCSVDFSSSYLPTGAFLTEKTNYLLDVILENNANGDGLQVVFPMLIETPMDIDGELFEVTYAGVRANSALTLNDNSRELWIRLTPGTNELELTGSDVGTLTVDLRWKERRR